MGLSQEALAKLSGLSRSTVNQLENATVKDLSLSRTPLTPTDLGDSMGSGTVAAAFAPHIATFLDELPLSLMARAVEQVHLEQHLPREVIWANMRRMATQLKATREIWHAA